MDSGCHKLSENIWFVWSKRSYSGEKVECHVCDGWTDGHTHGNVKIELESPKQNSQYVWWLKKEGLALSLETYRKTLQQFILSPKLTPNLNLIGTHNLPIIW